MGVNTMDFALPSPLVRLVLEHVPEEARLIHQKTVLGLDQGTLPGSEILQSTRQGDSMTVRPW